MIPVDPRRLCQLEIPVDDPPRALAFYASVFGWQPVPAEIHEYVVLAVPDDCPFGMSLVPRRAPAAATVPSNAGIVPYFGVADPEAVAVLAASHGGRRRFGPVKLAGYGEVYQIEDSEGNRVGLYRQPGERGLS